MVVLLDVTFLSDTRLNVHVKNKLTKANKSLHVLRTLGREGYNQTETDYQFNSIVLPKISSGFEVYGEAQSSVFLDRRKKHTRYISYSIDIHDKQDKKYALKLWA